MISALLLRFIRRLLDQPAGKEKRPHRPRLTLFGRSLLLITSELAVNAVCWILAGILFGRKQSTRSILSLALLAWVRDRVTIHLGIHGLTGYLSNTVADDRVEARSVFIAPE